MQVCLCIVFRDGIGHRSSFLYFELLCGLTNRSTNHCMLKRSYTSLWHMTGCCSVTSYTIEQAVERISSTSVSTFYSSSTPKTSAFPLPQVLLPHLLIQPSMFPIRKTHFLTSVRSLKMSERKPQIRIRMQCDNNRSRKRHQWRNSPA